MKILRRIMALLLMLFLPLQGVAAYAPASACNEDHAVQAQQAGSHDHGDLKHHDTHAPTAGHQHQSDNQPDDTAGNHSCCHHVFSGVPSTAMPGTPAPPHAVIQRVSMLHTLHIPDLPQRPPRA